MTTDASVWEVLADPSRRRIVSALAVRPRAVGELAAELPISRPAVSQHLRVLKEAGVVASAVDGTRRVYRVDSAALSALKDQLDTFWRRTLAGYSDVVAGPSEPDDPEPDDPEPDDPEPDVSETEEP